MMILKYLDYEQKEHLKVGCLNLCSVQDSAIYHLHLNLSKRLRLVVQNAVFLTG